MLAWPPRRQPRSLPSLRPLALFAAALPVVLAGCQSYETGIEVICQANVRCVECQEAPPELRSMKYAEYMERLVRNGEAKTFLESIANMDPQARVDALRREAKSAQLSECPLADYFEQALVVAPANAGPPPQAGPPPEPAQTSDADTDGTGESGDGGTGANDDTGGDADAEPIDDTTGDTEEAPAE